MLADCLDENGEAERAEFVRVQVAIHNRRPCHCGDHPDPTGCVACKEVRRLQRRERELLHNGGVAIETAIHRSKIWAGEALRDFDQLVMPNDEPRQAIWGRGFISHVRGPLADLVGGECWFCERMGGLRGDEHDQCHECGGTGTTPGVLHRVVADHPVERVEVVDRPPYFSVGTGKWVLVRSMIGYLEESWRSIQPDANQRTQEFATEADAREAQSAALLAWAKSTA